MQLSSLFSLAFLVAATISSANAVQYSDTYMVCLVNKARQSAGLSPVGLDDALTQAAQAHSDDMARMNNMDHTGSDGSSPGDRCERAGFQWTAVAENIAYGQNSMDEVMQVWMDSPGHRENILNPQYTMMGSAVSQGGSTPYYTQNFACDNGGARNIPSCDGDYPDMTNASQGSSRGTTTQTSTGGGRRGSGGSRGGNNGMSYGGDNGSTGGDYGTTSTGNYGGDYTMMGGKNGGMRSPFGGRRGGSRSGRGMMGSGMASGSDDQWFANQGFGRNPMRGSRSSGRFGGSYGGMGDNMGGGMAFGGRGGRGGFGQGNFGNQFGMNGGMGGFY